MVGLKAAFKTALLISAIWEAFVKYRWLKIQKLSAPNFKRWKDRFVDKLQSGKGFSWATREGKGICCHSSFFQKRRVQPLTCFEQALRMVQIKVSSGYPRHGGFQQKVSVKKPGFRASDWGGLGFRISGSRSRFGRSTLAWKHPVILSPRFGGSLLADDGRKAEHEAFHWDPVAGIDLGWGMKIVHYKNPLSTYQLKNNQCHRALCCGHKCKVLEVMTIIDGKPARGLSLVWSLFKSNGFFLMMHIWWYHFAVGEYSQMAGVWRAIFCGPNDQYLSPLTFTGGSLRCHLFFCPDFKQANQENAWHMCDTRHLGLPMFFFAFQVFSF